MRNKRILWTCSLLCLASILPYTILAKPRSPQQKMQAAATALEKGALPGKIKAPGAPMKQLVANEEYTIYGYDHGGFAVIANDDLLPPYSAIPTPATTRRRRTRIFAGGSPPSVRSPRPR